MLMRLGKYSLRKAFLLTLILFTLSGCLYSKVKAPLDTDVSVTELGSKVGTSKIQSILWLVAWGDGGTAAAAHDGGITVIRHMDVENQTIFFGLYSRTTTIVYGD
jgi:hypothetical protein